MSFRLEPVPSFRGLLLVRTRSRKRTSPAHALLSPRCTWTCSVGLNRIAARSSSGPRAWTSRGSCRGYSAAAGPPTAAPDEDVKLACRSNGEISLNIFKPPVGEHPTPPVILYLPTVAPADQVFGARDDEIVAALSAASNATIVRVNYRLGGDLQYPIPVHDVLAGYDYVKNRFAIDTCVARAARPKKTHLRMGVCGQLVGGSLAAMLALTESRLGEDGIAAAAVNSPVVDWVFPEHVSSEHNTTTAETQASGHTIQKASPRRRKRKAGRPSWDMFGHAAGLTTKQLELARSAYFRKPENYFDPFATPIHYLRSAGVNVPADRTVEPDELAALDGAPKPRKSLRKFPPSNSSLVLPHVRLSVGDANPLLDQNEEFVKLLRRSVVRTAQSRATTQAMLDRFDDIAAATEAERLQMAVETAEEKVEYHILRGVGLWATARDGEWLEEVWNVGRWFRKILG
ncbi:uncharacterized protein PV09_04701 [Verruconis gallopava]|uniref:Alpha/beta hydrolase fold-3 domain-containing protein n=1 Tax=Verruconis gallopava TaxID=253628 RepID=A0A0D1XPE5_9PEZI|nr:uncharacterized protein PV09_04701 [Verruconis gallopava]KIW04431.1 hypothetical protein PV09_04701 [Verruconis gallopava]